MAAGGGPPRDFRAAVRKISGVPISVGAAQVIGFHQLTTRNAVTKEM